MFFLISLLVFVVVAAGAFVVFGLLEQRTAQARIIKERLASIDQAIVRQPSEELILLRDDMLSSIPALNRLLSRSLYVSRMQSWLSQGALQIRAGKFLLLAGCCAVVAAAVTSVLTRVWMFGLLAAGFAAAVPFVYGGIKRSRRFRRF